MKKLFVFIVFAALVFSSCFDGLFNQVRGEGPIVKETRNVQNFTGIDLQSTGNVFVKQGDAFKVEVETHKNIAELFETEVKNGVLMLRFKPGTHSINYDKLNIYVEAPSFESFDITGSGELTSSGLLSGKALDIDVSGSGDVTIENAEYADVETSVTGSGNVRINGGKSDKTKFDVSGSGDLDAKGMQSKSVEADVSGSGTIRCTATEGIDAHIGGSGSIVYAGNPTQVKTKVSGSGDITKE